MQQNLKLDPSLVVPWSVELASHEPYPYPFVARYQRDQKSLFYLASLHSTDAHSKTFKMIDNLLAKENFDLVIVEGIAHEEGISPESVIKWASLQQASGRYEGFETAYAIANVHKIGIPFIGGEPEDQLVFNGLKKSGYQAEDVLFYFFVQQIFQYSQSASLPADTEAFFNEFIQRKREIVKLNSKLTFLDFQNWYLKKNGRVFVAAEIDFNIPAPVEKGKFFTQRISSALCECRDQFVVGVVDRLLQKHDRILVIFGGSHWSTQKVVYEKYFGPPKFYR